MNKEEKEIKRLKSLLSYNVIDTLKEKEFDKLAQLASIICETPIALISLIDDKKQWFKAKIGIDVDEMPKEITFCQYTIEKEELWEVEDTTKNELLKDNPNVTSENGIRYYAGIPLQCSLGYNIGTLCVADSKPKKISEKEKIALQIISEQVMILLEAKKRNDKLISELQELVKQKELESQRIIEKNSEEIKMFYDSISNTNGILEIDTNGNITKTNRLISVLLELTSNHLIGKNISTFFDIEINKRNLPDLIEHKNHLFQYKPTPNFTKWIQANFIKIENINGKIEKIILVCQDVSNRIQGQQELEHAKNTSDYLNKQKDQFIATVSHEIRTPINAILGFTDVLIEIEENNSKMDFLNSIKIAGLGLLHIINDILDISKIEAGMLQIDETPFQLNEVVSNVFTTLKLKASDKNLKFLYSIDSDVVQDLLGDKNRLNQVLINIIGNAVKFTEKGKVELRISQLKKEDQLIYLEFAVTDTGIGIPEKKLQTIFDRFSQAEVSTSRKFEGTGLGLSISKELIEMQNGTIEVSSIENKGTTFTFVIPYKVNPEKTTVLNAFTKTTLDKTISKNILLCEDNELNQKLITTIFEKTNHNVEIANNGLEALEFLKNKTYDVILMDLQMPIMDGYETTVKIRKELKLITPIIALTANSLIYEKERCMNIGMNDYLSKPFSKKELFELLNTYFYQAKEERKVNRFVSLNTLKEYIGEDTEQLQALIETFEEHLHTFEKSLQDGIIKKDYDSIRKCAHKMKTSFGMFSIYAKELENIESTSDLDYESNSTQILKPIQSQVKQIIEELKIIKQNEIGPY
ncbi:ATP-binding protein [Flavobacterium sp. NRK F7]|uniref:ATP-binding protein n=1 Tax=Flavobacterium sp. NRK F7 TaxID=2954930 RepID=UPI0020905649|nr:ATP-binding protein [Flavobacterium sp. NRK F7]MCO6162826.1 ATP-binding protein [Flavobacterium sp. NRK F7]